jgi:hypothetical protein
LDAKVWNFDQNTFMRPFFAFIAVVFSLLNGNGQTALPFGIALEPVTIPGMTGLHSFAHAQHNGDWLVVGGRLDGIHPRQPFASFPSSMNNAQLFVVRPATGQYWSASLASLPAGLAEQLQSTNQNYTQVGDTLYLMGGYAFSPTANDHITFSSLITVQVSSLIQSIQNNQPIQSLFKQVSDTVFHNTGGQLAYLDGHFYLVGGQVFTGRYNPMGHETYAQRYLPRVIQLTISNTGPTPQFAIVQAWHDNAHLRRRDYNLVHHQLGNGQRRLLISSGVFQPVTDLPFLHPVEIGPTGYNPRTDFAQLLSHYHSAKVSVMDTLQNQMTHVFFGGMAQYYYQNGSLVQDNTVPFVKTISGVIRLANDSLVEVTFPIEMPGFTGAGAEFFPAVDGQDIQYYSSSNNDTATVGYIFGGIHSTILNPFTTNQISLTQADAQCWRVKIYPLTLGSGGWLLPHSNPLRVFPNPGNGTFQVVMPHLEAGEYEYRVFDPLGQVVVQGVWKHQTPGAFQQSIEIQSVSGLYHLVFSQSEKVLGKASLLVNL